jgi:hypothetical protein
MSPGLVIKHLTEASGLIDAARTEMFSGLDQLDRAITQTYAALDGAQPGPLAAHWWAWSSPRNSPSVILPCGKRIQLRMPSTP